MKKRSLYWVVRDMMIRIKLSWITIFVPVLTSQDWAYANLKSER